MEMVLKQFSGMILEYYPSLFTGVSIILVYGNLVFVF
jgi:hypothetical protein